MKVRRWNILEWLIGNLIFEFIFRDEEQEEKGEDEAGGSGVDSVEELLVSSGSEDEEVIR